MGPVRSCRLLALFALLPLWLVLAVVPASPPPTPVGKLLILLFLGVIQWCAVSLWPAGTHAREVDCPVDSAGGYLWPATSPGIQLTAPCESASPRFVSQLGPELKRNCNYNGTWSDVDYTGCTLTTPAVPFLLLWHTLQTNNAAEVISNGPSLELQVRAKSYITHCDSFPLLASLVPIQESRLLEGISIPYTAVKMVAVVSVAFGVSVTFDVALNETELEKTGTDRLNAALTTLAPSSLSVYSVLPKGQGHVIVIPGGWTRYIDNVNRIAAVLFTICFCFASYLPMPTAKFSCSSLQRYSHAPLFLLDGSLPGELGICTMSQYIYTVYAIKSYMIHL